MSRTFTEEGWNTFGGYSFYQGVGPCTARAPGVPGRATARASSPSTVPTTPGRGRRTSSATSTRSSRYCEEHGLDVAYVTDVTVDEHPTIVANHRVLLSLGHDESWSYAERLGRVDAERKGVNVVFFGAAAVLRHVRLQPSPLGPDREEVDYRDADRGPAQRPRRARWR